MKSFLTSALLLLTVGIYSQDIEGATDYYLFNRMPDFEISKYEQIEFEALDVYDGKEKFTVEGKKFIIEYSHKNRSVANATFPSRLQVLRNYSNAILKAGGQIVFERHNAEYGYYSFIGENQKEVWMQLKPSRAGNSYRLVILERDALQQDIVIDADLIKNKIEIQGKIAIYGIYFDVGAATIKESSEPAFIQIAQYLKENTSVSCWIVGHTDADGSFETNSVLSFERAKAVKVHLQDTYGISADRLFAEGVGPLSPIATNATEDGKKLNRRVELVKK